MTADPPWRPATNAGQAGLAEDMRLRGAIRKILPHAFSCESSRVPLEHYDPALQARLSLKLRRTREALAQGRPRFCATFVCTISPDAGRPLNLTGTVDLDVLSGAILRMTFT